MAKWVNGAYKCFTLNNKTINRTTTTKTENNKQTAKKRKKKLKKTSKYNGRIEEKKNNKRRSANIHKRMLRTPSTPHVRSNNTESAVFWSFDDKPKGIIIRQYYNGHV